MRIEAHRIGEAIAFTVPERELYAERPRTIKEAAAMESRGVTRERLRFEGETVGGELLLRCSSRAGACPDEVMRFRKRCSPRP